MSVFTTLNDIWNKCEALLDSYSNGNVNGHDTHGLPELPSFNEHIQRYQTQDLISKLITVFNNTTTYNITFLSEYLNLLQTKDAVIVKNVTCSIMCTIEDVIRLESEVGIVPGEQRLVLCAFLCTLALSDKSPIALHPSLRQVVSRTSECERKELTKIWFEILPPAALTILSDAVRVAPPPNDSAPSLAEMLLRGAICAMPPRCRKCKPWDMPTHHVEKLNELLLNWPVQNPAEDSTMLALVGRILAITPLEFRPALLQRLEIVISTQHLNRVINARPDLKVGVPELQILFGAEEKTKSIKKNATKKFT